MKRWCYSIQMKSITTAQQICKTWHLTDNEKMQLLDQPGAAQQIVTINDGLYRIYDLDQDRASAWIKKPNRAFDNEPPINVMLAGDIERVRKYVMYRVYNA